MVSIDQEFERNWNEVGRLSVRVLCALFKLRVDRSARFLPRFTPYRIVRFSTPSAWSIRVPADAAKNRSLPPRPDPGIRRFRRGLPV